MAMKKRFYTMNSQMMAYDSGGVTKDFLTDHLGSITAEINQSQTRTYDTRYSAYGRTNWSTGIGCGFGWVGSYGYRETGLFHMSHYVRARHYSYLTGAWSTVDQLWPDESAYEYVGGRSPKVSDRFGLQAGNPAGDFSVMAPGGLKLAQIPLDEPCFGCASSAYLEFRSDPWHKNGYGPFAHCLACCVIAALTGDPACTWRMQESQMGGPRAGDPPSRQQMRTAPCGYGLGLAGRIKVPQRDVTATCAQACYARYPLPGSDPRWQHAPPAPFPPRYPLPNRNPAGCVPKSPSPPGTLLCVPAIPPGVPHYVPPK
jgi:RHS repeat-associated protein